MYKTILVPVDFSHPELARETLRIAREIGGKLSRIAALYVIADVPAYVAAELPKGLLQQNLVQARADLKALADEAGADSEVLSGHAPLRILEYAKTIAADLIVLGSHRPGLQDYFLGSTAARVVRHAECAVLVHR
jgi:nucleotide-binding universal stress UspA family protein